MFEIELIIGKIKEKLSADGEFYVISDMTGSEKRRFDKPVVSVGLLGGNGSSPGFLNYIGVEYDASKDKYDEIYGKRMDLTFSVDVRCHRENEEGSNCISVLSKVFQLLDDIGSGIRIREITCGDVSYDRTLGMYCCRAEVALTAFLYGKIEEDSTEFTKFTLKGELS